MGMNRAPCTQNLSAACDSPPHPGVFLPPHLFPLYLSPHLFSPAFVPVEPVMIAVNTNPVFTSLSLLTNINWPLALCRRQPRSFWAPQP